MRSVLLSPDLRTYLHTAKYLPKDLRQLISEQLRSRGATALIVEDEVAERFIDVFTERLAQVGFDSGYQLTAEGLELEDLIDRLTG
jgi:hypothetical protein